MVSDRGSASGAKGVCRSFHQSLASELRTATQSFGEVASVAAGSSWLSSVTIELPEVVPVFKAVQS